MRSTARAFHVAEPEHLGERLRRARTEAGLSQRSLAFPGCSAPYICRIEAGDRLPSLQIANALAERTGVTPEWLLGSEKAPELEAFIAMTSKVLLATDLLERQACNCMDAKGPTAGTKRKPKVVCLRCELLEILR